MSDIKSKNNLPEQLLVDTWWYGLTDRMPFNDFRQLAMRRQREGFNAVQLVMGIPPEVEITSSQASGGGKPAFSADGSMVNGEYVKSAIEKLQILREYNLTPIIYGAWGHQIDQVGVNGMTNWWRLVVSETEKYEPIYCLTGEIDLQYTSSKIVHRLLNKFCQNRAKKRRISKWLIVYSKLRRVTNRPIICHTTPYITSKEVSTSFSAITVQTGHSYTSKRLLWSLPLKFNKSKKPFINLEPWYEGICEGFWEKDQLFAFWSSMLAGAYGYCFGQHGVWNVGDGKFLAHWGGRTFEEAMKSDVTAKIGKSSKLFWCAKNMLQGKVRNLIKESPSFSISALDQSGRRMIFFESIETASCDAKGLLYNPSRCRFENENYPENGQAVIFEGFSAKERKKLEDIVHKLNFTEHAA